MPGPPPPPRRSNAGLTLAIIIGGGLVVVLIITAALVVLLSNGEKAPEERMADAAAKMSTAKALTLKGSFGAGQIQGEVKVTSSGRATGPVTLGTDRVTLLATDGNVFVKAGKDYWSREISTTVADNFPDVGERWGKVEATKLDFDFKRYATPAALAGKMRGVGKYSIRSDTKTTIQGRNALKITTFGGTYYLSDDDELLRVESSSPLFTVDVSRQSGAAADATLSEFRTRIGELNGAWDSTRLPRALKVDGCKNQSSSGCTVRVQVSTFGASGDSTEVSVFVWITANTKTGRRLGNCTASVTTTGVESVWTECRVSSAQWSSFYGNSTSEIRWWMQAIPVAIGANQSDVQNMQAAIDRE